MSSLLSLGRRKDAITFFFRRNDTSTEQQTDGGVITKCETETRLKWETLCLRSSCCEILFVVTCQKNTSITTGWDKYRFLISETEGLTFPKDGLGIHTMEQGRSWYWAQWGLQQTHGLVLEAALELNCLQEYSCKLSVVKLLRGAKWQNNALGCLFPEGEKKNRKVQKSNIPKAEGTKCYQDKMEKA